MAGQWGDRDAGECGTETHWEAAVLAAMSDAGGLVRTEASNGHGSCWVHNLFRRQSGQGFPRNPNGHGGQPLTDRGSTLPGMGGPGVLDSWSSLLAGWGERKTVGSSCPRDALPSNIMSDPPHYSKLGLCPLRGRPASPEPQEFSPHPDSAPRGPAPPSGGQAGFPPGIPAPLTPGSSTLPCVSPAVPGHASRDPGGRFCAPGLPSLPEGSGGSSSRSGGGGGG